MSAPHPFGSPPPSLPPELEARLSAALSAELAAPTRPWWRDAALTYFQTFSRQPFPPGVEPPVHPLDFYLQLRCPPDVTRPRCVNVY